MRNYFAVDLCVQRFWAVQTLVYVHACICVYVHIHIRLMCVYIRICICTHLENAIVCGIRRREQFVQPVCVAVPSRMCERIYAYVCICMYAYACNLHIYMCVHTRK